MFITIPTNPLNLCVVLFIFSIKKVENREIRISSSLAHIFSSYTLYKFNVVGRSQAYEDELIEYEKQLMVSP